MSEADGDKRKRNHFALWAIGFAIGAVLTLGLAIFFEEGMSVRWRLDTGDALGMDFDLIYAPAFVVFWVLSSGVLYLTPWLYKKPLVARTAGAAAAAGALPPTIGHFGMNKAVWLVLAWVSLLVGTGAMGAAIADRAVQELAMLALPLMLLGAVSYIIFWYKAWDRIQSEFSRTTPGKAIGFLFIPFFNLYWIFQVTVGFAADYNRLVEDYGLSDQIPPVNRGLFVAYAVLNVIPYGSFISSTILLPMVISQVCNGVNRLHELRQAANAA